MNVADMIREQTRPWAENDPSGHYLALAEGIAAMFQPIADLVSDSDEGPGWSPLLDINRVAVGNLGYLAQFIGKDLLPGLSDADQRARIRSTDGQDRGRPEALVGAAQQFLTGSKRVVLRERFGDNAWHVQLVTRVDETPDPAAVERAVMAQKPGGIIMHFAVSDGADWETIRLTFGSWSAVRDEFDNWQAVRDEPI